MKVLLVDDHPLYLDGLKVLLTARGFQVVGTARDGREAVQQASVLQPELILMDIQMPNLDGLAATRLIKAHFPEIKIVMLTLASEDESLFEAMRSGAFGYLLKTHDTEDFFAQLRGILQDETPLSPGLAVKLMKEFGAAEFAERGLGEVSPLPEKALLLSARQIEVLALVAQGFTYKEIGAKLFLSERTIKYHMGEIVQLLHLQNRAEVIAFARRMGYD